LPNARADSFESIHYTHTVPNKPMKGLAEPLSPKTQGAFEFGHFRIAGFVHGTL